MPAAWNNVAILCGVDGEDSSPGIRFSIWGKLMWCLLIQCPSYKQINSNNDDDVGSSLNPQHIEIASCSLKSSGPVEEARGQESLAAASVGPEPASVVVSGCSTQQLYDE